MVEEKPNAKTKGNKSKSPTARVNKEPNVSVSVPGDVKREPIFPADTDLLKPPPDKITIKTKESNSSKAAKVKKEVESFGRSEVTPTDVKVEEEEEEEEESPIGKDARPKAVPISVRVKDEEVRSSLGNAKEEVINVTTKKKKNKGQDDGKDKKHRKVYELPGQKHDPPEERDPLRIFYETLYEQRPTSEMAEFWMMEHGLLSPEKAKKAFNKKQKKQQTKVGTPVKSSSVKEACHNPENKSSHKDVSKASSKSKKKRADLSDEDSDDELIMPKKKLRMSS